MTGDIPVPVTDDWVTGWGPSYAGILCSRAQGGSPGPRCNMGELETATKDHLLNRTSKRGQCTETGSRWVAAWVGEGAGGAADC